MGLVSAVVSPDALLSTAQSCAEMILKNSQRAVRSAKETILEVMGRTLDDALRLETLNAYSCLGDFSEAGSVYRRSTRRTSRLPPVLEVARR